MSWLGPALEVVVALMRRASTARERAAKVWRRRRRTVVHDHGRRWRERER